MKIPGVGARWLTSCLVLAVREPTECEARICHLMLDLLHDLDFVVDSTSWDNYHHWDVVLDKRQKARFLGDKDYNIGRRRDGSCRDGRVRLHLCRL